MMLSCMLYTLAVCVLVGLGRCCDYSECGAKAPGDIIIGLLENCHSTVDDLDKRIKPQMHNCSDFNLRGFVRSSAFIHNIETINNSSFLPGIRLGYVICDTCADASKGLQSAKNMLAINNTLPIQRGLIERPPVKAIIGATYSEVSITVARLLSLYMVPLISTTSSTPTLDDKLRFPSFLRVIPSDIHQTRALAQLMARYGWNWVGVVSGDDAYGRAALRGFLKDAEEAKVCTAFQKVLPHYLDHSDNKLRIREVVNEIRSSKAGVILLILKSQLVRQLFKEMIREGISRTWIASDAWSMSKTLATMKGINMVGDIFGFSFMSGQTPGLKHYLQNLPPASPQVVNRFVEEYKNLRFECSPDVQEHKDCLANKTAAECPLPDSLKFKSPSACKIPNPQEANDDFLTCTVDLGIAYGERLAVWSLAHALKSLLKCNQSFCPGERNFPPWKLLQVLKDINFTIDGQNLFFDGSGSSTTGYHLVNWARHGDVRRFRVVGQYKVLENVVDIREDIDWGTPNKTTPKSKCSESCPPGTAKRILSVFCCYNCSICDEGTYSNVSNQESCHKCPPGTHSLKGWTHCEQRTEDYFRWEAPLAIALLVITGIGFVLLFSVIIILVVGRQSAVFKVAGGKLCFVMIAGLAVSFGAVVLFVGKPNDHVCRSRQTMYSLGFTLSVSCILVKAFRTFLAFLLDRNQQYRLNKLYKPPVIVVCGTAIQGLICVFWLVFDSPKVEAITSYESMRIVRQCNEGSGLGFGFMLSYIALLAFICFILAVKGRKVPERFNETGYIIFSMLIYLLSVCFVPIYITQIELRYVIQALAILVSNFGIIFCHFIPKCYMILCKNKTDISKQSYLERVRIFSITTTDTMFENISAGARESDASNQRISVTTISSTDTEANTVESLGSSPDTVESLGSSTDTVESLGSPTVTVESLGSSTVTVESLGSSTVTVESLGSSTVTVESLGSTVREFDELRNWDSSPHIRKRSRRKSI